MTREAPAMRYISGECRKQRRYPETGFEEVGQIGNGLVFTGDSAGVKSTIVVGLRKQSKSRCINRLKKHPSHSAPNPRLPGYPAGETLILGGGSETAGVVNCNRAF